MKGARLHILVSLLIGCGVCFADNGGGKIVSLIAAGAELRGAEVVVWWAADEYPGVAGFYLERLVPEKGTFTRVQDVLVSPIIPTLADGRRCEVVDREAAAGVRATYRLYVVWSDRSFTLTEPFDVVPVVAEVNKSSAVDVPGAAALPWISPSVAGDRLKVSVETNGLYFLGVEAIAAGLYGWNTGAVGTAISSGQFLLSCGTNEVAWLAAGGATGIYFYGEAPSSIHTRQNVYWLRPGAGKTMSASGGTPPSPAPSNQLYRASLHYETDVFSMYAELACTNVDADIWFWTLTQGGTSSSNATVNMNVTGVAPWQQPAVLTAHLQGGQISTGDSSDFRLNFFLNGVYLGSTNWGGRIPCDPSFPVTNLVEGANAVKIQAFKLAGDPPSTFSLLQSLDLEYDRLYVPMGSQTFCQGDSNPVVTVSGFGTADIRVLDITRPFSPVWVDSAAVDGVSGGVYRVSFAPASPTNRYLVSEGALLPVSVAGRRLAGWRETSNAWDYVVIAPPGFLVQAQALADYRAAQGLRAVVADVTSIYDEFNTGVVHPLAIRSFLSNAVRSWARAPQYVVLAGAGNLNYRNVGNMWTNDPCLIPPVTIYSTTTSRLGGSDGPIADIDGDRAPDVALGRLPFATTNEFLGWIDKMRAFESNSVSWRTVSLIAGSPDDAGNFPTSSDSLAERVPKVYANDRNYWTTQTLAQVRTRLFGAFNTGCSLMTYVGHGNSFQLADQSGGSKILTVSDVLALTNRSSAPIFLGMTCEFGRFEKPTAANQISGRLMRQAAGGAVAVWSATTTVANDDSVRLGGFVLDRLFSREDARMGQAIREAMVMEQAGRPDSHLLESYNLLGDPAMRTRLMGKRGFTLVIR